ncbi:OadG family transporter subunit [Alkalimonas sp.]|uniref:OadG family protein n=1 Tax=Alkalimonas sp. TaxID=1872453 RepID=UPI00263B56D3|nr:OadG family transporter subunit [Alkalimonas sp.]MCC5827581.1 OadG family protein [Alkalimonas sp.]
MAVSTMLQQAAELMAIGMATVFVFLTVLVIIIQLMSLSIRRFFPTKKTTATTVEVVESDTISPRVVAVITAAIHQHRQQQN